MTMLFVRPPEVRAADLGHTVVLLHEGTGAVRALLGAHREAFLALEAIGTPARGTEAEALTVSLPDAGFLRPARTGTAPAPVVVVPATGPSWGTQEAPGALPEHGPPSLVWAPVAVCALATVLLVRAVGRRTHAFCRLLRLVRIATWMARRPARDTQVVAVLNCVRVIGGVSPVRTACLEETVAAMLALAVTGRRAGWCHGIAADPIRLHAWLSLDGCPVGEPASTLRFTPLIQLPEPATVPSRTCGRAARGDIS
ncbi:lasso peptide biosynthesis B2 protein [Pseudonocardia alni]|uniref:lasso peptide biosynthesis B2 protein n=1 Tax=Pseudonocardia alni TaxID=33907 RepID=UPI00280B1C91|nr:lasso peptide biosynthesis B2 protein [Pseudonocardia alni]